MSKLGNSVRVTLGAALDADDTFIVTNAVQFYDRVPDPRGELARALLTDDLQAPTKFEIVTFTRVINNVLRNVARGQEGTTATTWDAGAFLVQDITDGMLVDLAGSGFLKLEDGSLTEDDVPADSVSDHPFAVPYIQIGTIAEPTIASGEAQIYIDSADDGVKIKSGAGVTVLVA